MSKSSSTGGCYTSIEEFKKVIEDRDDIENKKEEK